MRKRTTARSPGVVRGAMHSGKKWHSALWLDAKHSNPFYCIYCCSLATLATQQQTDGKMQTADCKYFNKIVVPFPSLMGTDTALFRLTSVIFSLTRVIFGPNRVIFNLTRVIFSLTGVIFNLTRVIY